MCVSELHECVSVSVSVCRGSGGRQLTSLLWFTVMVCVCVHVHV